MTESIVGRIRLDVQLGCYGSFLVEIDDLTNNSRETHFYRGISLGSDGEKHGYPTFSDNHSVAAALRAFADKLDELFGERQRDALLAWQGGKAESTIQLILEYGTEEAKARVRTYLSNQTTGDVPK